MSVVAVVLAALAAWWASGAGTRRLLTPRARGPARERALGSRTRLSLGLGSGMVAVQLMPGPWWLRAAASGVVAVVVYAALSRIGPDLRALEAERRAGIPEALVLLACGVEAGLPLAAVVDAVAPTLRGAVRADLERVRAAQQVGLGERAAWGCLVDSPVWRRVAADLGRLAASGAAVAPVLRRHATQLTRAHHDARVEAARTVGVRSVLPLMVCFLPAFFLLGIVPAVGGALLNLFG